jgi:hypothetical protein
MRWLLALFLMVGAQAHAALPAGVVAWWTLDNTLDDLGGNYPLTQVGTMTYDGGPCFEDGDMAGVFSGTKYLTSADARAAMSGLTTWTVEGDIYMGSLAPATQGFFSSFNGAALSPALSFQAQQNGALRIVTDDANIYDSASGVITTGSCQYFQVVVDGTNLKAYYGTRAGLTEVIDVTATAVDFPEAGSIFVGVYGRAVGFAPLTGGYLSNVILSNVARNGTPTVMTGSPGDKRGLKLKNYLRTKLGRMLLPIPPLFATRLEAAPQDQMGMSREVPRVHKKLVLRATKTQTRKDVLSGRITRTPTRTRTPTPNRSRTETATPTASPTATPTSTPTPGEQKAEALGGDER